jgi:hypothetical protein
VESPGDLLQGEGTTNLHEGRKGLLVGDKCPQGLVAVVETQHNVEHQDALVDRVSEVSKCINLALHPPAELSHREIALLE